LQRVAEEQYTDDAPLKEQLLHLQIELENSAITEEQYIEREAQILRDLREIQNRKRELTGLPPEEGTGLSGKVKGESGVSLTWDPNNHTGISTGAEQATLLHCCALLWGCGLQAVHHLI
jgi:hypothetical protein